MVTGDANSVRNLIGVANSGILKAPINIAELPSVSGTKVSPAMNAGILMVKKPSGATPRIKTNAGSIASPR